MTTTKNIEDATRDQVAQILPGTISKTLESYEMFVRDMKEGNDTKNFHDAHRAAKVAIAHIELLIKLARWADLPEKDAASTHTELAGLLERAYEDVVQYKSLHADEMEDGDGDV